MGIKGLGACTAWSSTQSCRQFVEFRLCMNLFCRPEITQLDRKILVHHKDIFGLDVAVDPSMVMLFCISF